MGTQRWRMGVALLAVMSLLRVTLAAQQPVSHETVTVGSISATGLAATTVSPSGVGQVSSCAFTVEGGPIRVWVDGTDPTASTGHWFAIGALVVMTTYLAAKQFRVIAVNASATLQATCLKGGAPVTVGAPLVVSYDPGPVGAACNPLTRAAGICR